MTAKPAARVRNENVIAGAIALIVFIVYQTTMCPTVSFTDSGELASVATTLGIAHPTGYPLWTLIGRLAVLLPVSSQEIVRLNLLGSLLTALAVIFFFRLVLTLYRSPRVFRYKVVANREDEHWLPIIAASITALIVGFSSTIWSQSVEIEVYALHAFLIILTMSYFISGIEEQLSDPEILSRRLFLFSFLLGLSFANHMTTVLLAPGFFYLYFVSVGFNKKSWQILVALTPFFFLGLSVYAYLPIRSISGTLLDWGHPVTLERFWWHVTGKQYQTWMFAGGDVVSKQLHYFLTNFPNEYCWPVVAFIVVGLIETLSRSIRLLVFLILLFLACVAYAVNFDIHEIDPYFILAYLACGCVIGTALKRVLEWSRNRKLRFSTSVTLGILISLPIIQVVDNRSDVDQSDNYQATEFVHTVFGQLESHAVVFTSLWDYFVSPAYYFQLVRNERPDIILIDAELLQNRTWYFLQLEREHPGILDSSQEKVSAFLTELTKFENGEPYAFATIKGTWDDLLEDLVAKSILHHPVYVDSRVTVQFLQKFDGVPQGLLVRLVRKGDSGDWKPITGAFKQGTFENYVTSDLRRYYASMYTLHSYWLLSHKRPTEAMVYLQNALNVDPTYLPAVNLKTQLSRRAG